jgi:predicted glycogen debranching enzyme
MSRRFALRGDWEGGSRLEWLETNGLGGYASSTASGANTRRYHGLLVAATAPPVGRVVLLSKLEERISAGAECYELGANQYPGAVHPRGFEFLDAFEREMFPSFEYSAGTVRLRKTVAAIHGQNTTVIVYEVLDAPGEIVLELKPLIAARDHHALTHANDAIRREGTFEGGVFSLRPYDGLPALYLAVPGSAFTPAPDWHYCFQYALEQERGLDAHEDLFTPGHFSLSLARGARVAIIASVDDPAARDGLALFDAERIRRERLIRTATLQGTLGQRLALAADQFIVRRGVDRQTIIAGYPWFTDWGRDAMIALPGLCLTTGRFDDARKILLAFAESVSEGMLPNRFPDGGEPPEYNTADATLWFFVAVQKYLDSTRDEVFVREAMLPVLRDIIGWHERGTRHNIHEDEDGLLVCGAAGDQLTWMDARVGDEVITPRLGKPVEINALWFNALSILASLERKWGFPAAAQGLAVRAARVRLRFRQLFWNEAAGGLYDVVNGDERDATLRPNQIFALSLPHQLIEGPDAERLLASVESKLLTPVGLRTLSPDDPRFIATYAGPPAERDRAYHQGTVWPWLLGPYLTALVRVRGARGVAEGRKILTAFAEHLDEACAGTISEIFDAMPPHAARGCVAQAWSVGEVLRAAVEDLGMALPLAANPGRVETSVPSPSLKKRP